MNGQLPRWVDYGLIPLINVTIAFFVAGLVVIAIGENPLDVVRIMLRGALGYGEGVGFTLYYATDFIFAGLAVAVAFHAGLFNIGGEGQATIAGLGVALVCLALNGQPWWLVAPLAIVAAMVFSAAWAYVPGALQAYRGSHIVINTIMFNFIATSAMVYLLTHVLKPMGQMAPETRTFDVATRLPFMKDYITPLGYDLGQSPLNLSILIAAAACVLVYLLIWRTRLGYALRTVGTNPTAALYAGIDPKRITVIAMIISGALVGLIAINEVMGTHHRLFLGFTGGAGFVGIAVALMGRSHPIGIALAALLFGMLYQGGAELAFEKPTITRDMIVAIQGLVILFAGALEHMFRPALERMFITARAATA
ncbi:MAG: ABC transporter permease [Hyphomicrobiaceae bacterium]|nr:ABC transporter permease [Hyphomicrobiaceae bacterium]